MVRLGPRPHRLTPAYSVNRTRNENAAASAAGAQPAELGLDAGAEGRVQLAPADGEDLHLPQRALAGPPIAGDEHARVVDERGHQPGVELGRVGRHDHETALDVAHGMDPYLP